MARRWTSCDNKSKDNKSVEASCIPVTSDFFGGGNSEYITFNYVKDGAELFADNQPVEDISLMQIHYFLPSTKDYLEAKRKIRRVILEEGGTYPDVTVLMEPDNKTRQHCIRMMNLKMIMIWRNSTWHILV